MHTSKVVHNNLYLNNILVNPEGKAYITGFGIPYTQSKVSNPRPAIWTPPENMPTPEGDIYNVGLVLKALATGQEPENAEIPEGITDALKAILTGCFEQTRANRITDDALIADLFKNNDIFGPVLRL